MKMSKKLYEQIKGDLAIVAPIYTPQGEKSNTKYLWDMFGEIQCQRSNENHPAFIRCPERRVLAYLPEYREMFDFEDLNDSHIETALFKAAKELGLI
jgi:hypothetical protein